MSSPNLALGEDGIKVDFAKTIARMVKEGELDEETANIIRQYKSLILPSLKSEPKTEEEIQERKEELEKEIKTLLKDFKVEETTENEYDNERADYLLELLKKVELQKMPLSMLENIPDLLDQIKNGYFSAYGNNVAIEAESLPASEILYDKTEGGIKLMVEKATAKIRSYIFGNKTKELSAITNNPLHSIDAVFGNHEDHAIYNEIFGKAGISMSKFGAEVDKLAEKILYIDNKIDNKFIGNPNKIAEFKWRVMTYLLQRERDSNPSKESTTFSGKQALEAQIDGIKKREISYYDKKDQVIFEKILSDKSIQDENGEISAEKLFNSLDPLQKEMIKVVDKTNEVVYEKALHAGATIGGSRPTMYNNYIRHDTVYANEKQANQAVSKIFNRFKSASIKAGTLQERTEGVKNINFDPLAATLNGARETLLDFHMTNPVKTIQRTINKAIYKASNEPEINEEHLESLIAVRDAFNEALKIAFDSNMAHKKNSVLARMEGIGYKALLASIPRAGAEFSSNLGYVLIAKPKGYGVGISKYANLSMRADSRDIMSNSLSEATNKAFGRKALGKFMESTMFDTKQSVKKAKAKGVAGRVTSVVGKYLNYPLKGIDYLHTGLISTPDMMVSRPLWFGTMAIEFKKESGQDINFDAIRENDKAYLKEHKAAIKKARLKADKEVTMAATSVNIFNGVLSGKINPDDNTATVLWKKINGFMQTFMIYEYTTFRDGILGLVYGGKISRRKGLALIAAATLRMSSYMVMYSLLREMFDVMLGSMLFDDFEEEEIDYTALMKRQLTGSIATLLLQRNLGAIGRMPIAWGVEAMNKEHGGFLRSYPDQDYDSFEHSILFSPVSFQDLTEGNISKTLIQGFSGAMSPYIKGGIRAGTLAQRATSSERWDTRQKNIKELKVRGTVDALGLIGILPLYKDIRRVTLRQLYKDYNKKKK